MAVKGVERTYGAILYDKGTGRWRIPTLEPHVSIRLKALFPRLPKSRPAPFHLADTAETALDLEWFLSRYPLEISDADRRRLVRNRKTREREIRDSERIFLPGYTPRTFQINGNLRGYQAQAAELLLLNKRLLVGDVLGLGKTLIAIGAMAAEGTLPAMVVVQTHLPAQWLEQIEKFTGATVHVIRGTRPYDLPPADVYVTTYSRLSGWVDIFRSGIFKMVVFDEVQELRRSESQKYQAADVLSREARFVLGLSATPLYNYAEDLFNVLSVIKEGCLGTRDEFFREWVSGGRTVADPDALGTYLRENHLFLRRTRKDVSRELPPVNRIVHTIGYDEAAVKSVEDVARALAIRATTGEFTERGRASRELDLLARQITGVSKAKYVAEYIRMLLENGESVLLAGWHREVYDIWLRELAEFNPVMYTGSESPVQKRKSKDAFIAGESRLMIISLRSGVGLDGLQNACSVVVHGELDWSPMIHEQVRGRLDRDGQKEQVTEIYLVSDTGSDPPMVNVLGLKSSQTHGILDPGEIPMQQYTDESRIQILAKQYLTKTAA